MIEKMYHGMREYECQVVGCAHQSFENMEDISSERIEEDRIVFPERIMYGEDIYFSGLVMLLCGSYHHIGETLCHYFRNVGGITNRNNDDGEIMRLDDVREHSWIGFPISRSQMDASLHLSGL